MFAEVLQNLVVFGIGNQFVAYLDTAILPTITDSISYVRTATFVRISITTPMVFGISN